MADSNYDVEDILEELKKRKETPIGDDINPASSDEEKIDEKEKKAGKTDEAVAENAEIKEKRNEETKKMPEKAEPEVEQEAEEAEENDAPEDDDDGEVDLLQLAAAAEIGEKKIPEDSKKKKKSKKKKDEKVKFRKTKKRQNCYFNHLRSSCAYNRRALLGCILYKRTS